MMRAFLFVAACGGVALIVLAVVDIALGWPL